MIVLAVVGGRHRGSCWSFRQPAQRRRLHAAILRLPYFGPLARRFATAQVSRTLATLLSGGIPLVNALDIAARATGNRSIGDHLVGRRASRCARDAAWRSRWPSGGMFPHIAVEMVEVGESTGAMADMLNSVADFYDEENETSLTRFSNLIQPLLLIVMGAVIAGLLLSLYMPLFRSELAHHLIWLNTSPPSTRLPTSPAATADPIEPRSKRAVSPSATSSSSSTSSTFTSTTRCSAASPPT